MKKIMKQLPSGELSRDIIMENMDLCPCGSDKMIFVCHPLKQGKVVLPAASNCKPPGEKTGFSHPNCYARQLGDCSKEMSREHLIPEAMLWLVAPNGKLSYRGYEWQKDGKEVITTSPKKMRSWCLCKRHNNAVSDLAKSGESFFKAIQKTGSWLEYGASVVPPQSRAIWVKGEDIERLILVTLCTHIVVNKMFGGNWEPPKEWLEIIWEMKPMPPNCGLIHSQWLGDVVPQTEGLGFNVLTLDGAPGQPVGGKISLENWDFSIVMSPTKKVSINRDGKQGAWMRMGTMSVTYKNAEVIFCFGWNDGELSRGMIGITWMPKAEAAIK